MDHIESVAAGQKISILKILFGNGKGSGAAGVFYSAAGSANILI